jgi:hypothetical protein
MPKMGESIMEATILKWRKNPGDRVELDEPVLDIATGQSGQRGTLAGSRRVGGKSCFRKTT